MSQKRAFLTQARDAEMGPNLPSKSVKGQTPRRIGGFLSIAKGLTSTVECEGSFSGDFLQLSGRETAHGRRSHRRRNRERESCYEGGIQYHSLGSPARRTRRVLRRLDD